MVQNDEETENANEEDENGYEDDFDADYVQAPAHVPTAIAHSLGRDRSHLEEQAVPEIIHDQAEEDQEEVRPPGKIF